MKAKPMQNSMGVVQRTRPRHMVAIQDMNCTPEGRAMSRPTAAKKAEARVTEGTAKMTMKAMASIDHTKMGMRFTVIPGPRILKAVTMKLTAPTVVEMPTNITPRPQKSRFTPGENWRLVRGT